MNIKAIIQDALDPHLLRVYARNGDTVSLYAKDELTIINEITSMAASILSSAVKEENDEEEESISQDNIKPQVSVHGVIGSPMGICDIVMYR